ncbi:hypothetical protein ACE6H2_015564 [Prunus campanulata]
MGVFQGLECVRCMGHKICWYFNIEKIFVSKGTFDKGGWNSNLLTHISPTYNIAVVVSIDPHRVYLKNPEDVGFKTIRVTNPGPNGEEFAWYQCTYRARRKDTYTQMELGARRIGNSCPRMAF